ncbi:MAG: J domain-containing protein [Kofleriaceae bacterium]
MTVLASGTTDDRPWGRTLAALAARRFSGEVRVSAGGKAYLLGLDGGALVAASSPLAADSAAKLALTAGLITSTQVAELSRRVAAAPGTDEVDVLAAMVTLPAEHADRLRRRAMATKAIRTFALTGATFEVHDERTLASASEIAIDLRALIYLGARTHLAEVGLRAALGGGTLRLADGAVEVIPQYGFGAEAQPVLERLRDGTTADELAGMGGGDPRPTLAIAYALVVTGAALGAGDRPTGVTTPPAAAAPVPAPRPAAAPNAAGPTPAGSSATGPSRAAARPRAAAARAKAPAMTPEELAALVTEKLAVLDGGGDHFALLGVTEQTAPDVVRTTYFALARKLHPDRLTALKFDDDDRAAQRLFAAINEAFRVLTNSKDRAEYLRVLRAGGKAALARQEAEAEAMALRILGAEEHFRAGEMALRREHFEVAARAFAEAIEMNPEEADYHALLGWALFAGATDKAAVTQPARAALTHAAKLSPKSATAPFYLGRIARMLGEDAAAMSSFREVLRLQPGHTEAASELRLLESRAAKKK